MNVHVIRASSRHQLLINARRRVGPEALILSVREGMRKDGKGKEWEAVIAKDESPNQESATPKRRKPAQRKPKQVRSKAQRRSAEPVLEGTRKRSTDTTNTYNRVGASSDTQPIKQTPKPKQQRKAPAQVLDFSAMRTESESASFTSIESLKNEITEHIRTGFAAGSTPAPELLYMARRLTQIEDSILAQTFGSRGLSAESLPVLRSLQQSGYPETDALRVIERATRALNNSDSALLDRGTTALIGEVRTIIANKISVATMRERSAPGLVIFVGGAGVGKTGLAAKLAADLCLGGANRPILGVLQPKRAMGVAMVRRYAEHLGIDFARVSDSRHLAALMETSAERPVILDSSAVSPMNTNELQQLRRLLRQVPRAEVHAVVPATYGVQDLENAIDSFTNVGATRISVTRLDEAPFVGRVVAAAERSQLPIGYLSRGTRIPDDLIRPKVDSLLNAVFNQHPMMAE